MKRLLLFAAISAGGVESVSAQTVADPAKQAELLLQSGLAHSKAGEFGPAFADFAASYKLVPKASTAALACQAQANADPTHPSMAMTWLANWQSSAAKETTPDDKGWRALQRAQAAIAESVKGVEAGLEKLNQSNVALEQKVAELEKQKRQLQFTLKTIAIDFRGSLPAADRDRLDAKLRAGSADDSR